MDPSRRDFWSRFALAGGVFFCLVGTALYLLGPAWILTLKGASFSWASLGLLFVILVLFAVDAAVLLIEFLVLGLRVTFREARAALRLGERYPRNLLRRMGPGFLGLVAGTSLAFGAAWAFAQGDAWRLAYARSHPHSALAVDFVRATQHLDTVRRSTGRFPADSGELADGMSAAGLHMRYSTLDRAAWRDPWGRPFVYRPRKLKGLLSRGWEADLYSTGPNGVDDGGQGDDIAAESILSGFKVKLPWAGK